MDNQTTHIDSLVSDSVLPMALNNTNRFLVLEFLLTRLNQLPKCAVIMLTHIVPAASLEFLADHFSLFGDGWQFATTDIDKRQLIKEAIAIHRHKGTPWAIKRVLHLLGYGDCEIDERYWSNNHDNTIRHNAERRYGGRGYWTYYRIILSQQISDEEAERIKALLKDVAPLRCKLMRIDLTLKRHDSKIKHNGINTYNGVLKSWLT